MLKANEVIFAPIFQWASVQTYRAKKELTHEGIAQRLKRNTIWYWRLGIDPDSVGTFGYPHGIYPTRLIIGSVGNRLPISSACHFSALRARIRWHLRHKRGFGKSHPQLLVVRAWDQAPKTNCEVAIHLTPTEYLRRDGCAACALCAHAPLLCAS